MLVALLTLSPTVVPASIGKSETIERQKESVVPMLALLEGGYDLVALETSVRSCLETLQRR